MIPRPQLRRSSRNGQDHSARGSSGSSGLAGCPRPSHPPSLASSIVIEEVVDPLNGLVERARHDKGAPFEPEVLRALRELHRCNRPVYERLRGQLRDKGVRVRQLEAEMGQEDQNGDKPETMLFPKIEPADEPVDAARMLDELATLVRRYVIVSPEAQVAIALWIAHTWVYQRFDHTPRLGVTSPVKRCGKSTLLNLLELLCRRPVKADSLTTAVTFRLIEACAPITLLVDEADTFLRENQELRGVLNGGYEKKGCVLRNVERERDYEPKAFKTFAPVALGAIGELPSTLEDRAVPVRLERKAGGDSVCSMHDEGAKEQVEVLQRHLARWAQDSAQTLILRPARTPGMNDRQIDISAPLLSIADSAGEDWGVRARSALLKLFAQQDEADQSLSIRLLSDVRQLFDDTRADWLPTGQMIAYLVDISDGPWAAMPGNGRPLNANRLGRMLSDFKVKPRQHWQQDRSNRRGYARADLQHAFDLYRPAPVPAAGGEGGCEAPGQPARPLEPLDSAEQRPRDYVTDTRSQAERQYEESRDRMAVERRIQRNREAGAPTAESSEQKPKHPLYEPADRRLMLVERLKRRQSDAGGGQTGEGVP